MNNVSPKTRMEPMALPMHKLFLASTKRTNIYKKKIVMYTKNFTIGYYNKFNLQKHWEVSHL